MWNCTYKPLLGGPLPGSQATTSIQGHRPELDETVINEFLIHGVQNPPDLEGVEEDQLLIIQWNIQDKLKNEMKKEKRILQRESNNMNRNMTLLIRHY